MTKLIALFFLMAGPPVQAPDDEEKNDCSAEEGQRGRGNKGSKGDGEAQECGREARRISNGY